MNIPILLLVALGCTSLSWSYNILGIFPHPGLSDFYFFHPIMRGLAEAGHDVTVISHFPDKSPPAHYKDLVLTDVDALVNVIDVKTVNRRTYFNKFNEIFVLKDWAKSACNHTFRSPALAQALKQKKRYDVVLLELFNSDCMMAVAHVLGAPVISLCSSVLLPWHYERIGSPHFPSYMPTFFMDQSEQMDFIHRVGNWISYHAINFLYKYHIETQDNELIRRKFGHNMPDVAELARETSLIFVNQHYTISGARPSPPGLIELGGIHIQKAKTLDVEYQRYLDNAEHGVILISWGSMIRAGSLPNEKREGILKALKRLKQKVIWKWENDTLSHQPSNVLISKWIPQREILCHPNVKVFLTHAGLMGITEAVYCGVPIVATPIYADQFNNAAALVHRGMGVVLNYDDISEATIVKAIRKVLEKKYMENAKSVSFAFRNRPRTSLETAIWWVEHVIKTDGAPLAKSVAVRMSRFAYHSLDVYAFFSTIILFVIISCVWAFNRFCSRGKRTEKVKTN